jgi:hypothetical protein
MTAKTHRVQLPSENRTVQYSNGHLRTFLVRISKGYGGHFVSKTGQIVRISNGLAAILFLPSENRTFLSGFRMVKTRWLPKVF